VSGTNAVSGPEFLFFLGVVKPQIILYSIKSFTLPLGKRKEKQETPWL